MSEVREQSFEYLIIGGGAAGVSCAETIRRRDTEASIAILSADSELPYSRVMLPAYVKGEIARDDVFLRKSDHFLKENITIVIGCRVTELRRDEKWVLTEQGEKYHFGKLCIATGGRAREILLEESDGEQEFYYLQTLADADRLKEAMERNRGKRWVVIGGGFIGIEFANIAHHYGSEVTMLVSRDQVFAGKVSREGAVVLENALASMGVVVVHNARAQAVTKRQEGVVVTSTQGTFGPALTGVGVGIDRTQQWLGAQEQKGGIRTNMELATAEGDIFAAGDVAVRTEDGGKPMMMGNWASAVQMGMIAGNNMTGMHMGPYIPGIYSIHVGSIHVSFIGGILGASAHSIVRTLGASSRIEFGFEDGVLMSVVLMNAHHEMGQCIRLLHARATLEGKEMFLKDPTFPLASL